MDSIEVKEEKLTKKYGLFTAISMSVGILIGSGIFIKCGKVLSLTSGNMGYGILTVVIVGLIAIICSLFFSVVAQKYENANGLVDFSNESLGKRYGYYMGWFMTTVYYPSLTVILSFFSAVFLCCLIGYKVFDFDKGITNLDVPLGVGAGLTLLLYGANMLSPDLGGRMQVVMCIIKLVPLVIMGIGGIIYGLVKGTTKAVLDYTKSETYKMKKENGEVNIFDAITGFAFSFEGYICATSINTELENPKKNLPIALVVGNLFALVIYVLYIFSMSCIGDAELIMGTWPLGETLPEIAFTKVFSSKVVGKISYVFLIISCLGTLNGLVMGQIRSLYTVASRGFGPKPDLFSEVDKRSNVTIKSGIFGLLIYGFWYIWSTLFWMKGPDGFGGIHKNLWFGWEGDELCVVILYLAYIPMMFAIMIKANELGFIKRFIIPIFSIACCVFLIVASFVGKGYEQNIGFIIFVIVLMFIAFLFTDDFKNLIGKCKSCCGKGEKGEEKKTGEKEENAESERGKVADEQEEVKKIEVKNSLD